MASEGDLGIREAVSTMDHGRVGPVTIVVVLQSSSGDALNQQAQRCTSSTSAHGGGCGIIGSIDENAASALVRLANCDERLGRPPVTQRSTQSIAGATPATFVDPKISVTRLQKAAFKTTSLSSEACSVGWPRRIWLKLRRSCEGIGRRQPFRSLSRAGAASRQPSTRPDSADIGIIVLVYAE